jgi:hypothetical protein
MSHSGRTALKERQKSSVVYIVGPWWLLISSKRLWMWQGESGIVSASNRRAFYERTLISILR